MIRTWVKSKEIIPKILIKKDMIDKPCSALDKMIKYFNEILKD